MRSQVQWVSSLTHDSSRLHEPVRLLINAFGVTPGAFFAMARMHLIAVDSGACLACCPNCITWHAQWLRAVNILSTWRCLISDYAHAAMLSDRASLQVFDVRVPCRASGLRVWGRMHSMMDDQMHDYIDHADWLRERLAFWTEGDSVWVILAAEAPGQPGRLPIMAGTDRQDALVGHAANAWMHSVHLNAAYVTMRQGTCLVVPCVLHHTAYDCRDADFGTMHREGIKLWHGRIVSHHWHDLAHQRLFCPCHKLQANVALKPTHIYSAAEGDGRWALHLAWLAAGT